MPEIRKPHLVLSAVLSGVIFSLAWPERGFAGLLFIGFVPLFFLEEKISESRERFGRFRVLFYSYPAFFTWNLLTTWWIVNSTLVGAILAILLNSLFMAIVFQVFHFTKVRLKSPAAGYASLVFFWISFEYLHLNWMLNWPWLNLGNGFGSFYRWVQWYEYTGTLGGTLWVLVANILFFLLLKAVIRQKSAFSRIGVFRFLLYIISWIGIPIIFSYLIYNNYKEKQDPYSFVVVQPNLDPYSEQYELPPQEVIGRILGLADPLTDSSTGFLVAPESAIQEQMWDDQIEAFGSIRLLRDQVSRYPQLNILIGGSTFYEFKEGETITRTARKFKDVDKYYDAFNTAIFLDSTSEIQTYHKSKLTPGVESLPSFRGFEWLEKFAIDLGGTVGSLGTDKIRKVYTTTQQVKIAPIICYESIFGEFYSEFVRNGAQIICIITNDGWWGNTPGHRQHYAFSHLRAIETRRSIVRSANTGISAFIDQRGDASQETRYWVPGAIKGEVNANSELTFYTRHGDYLAKIAVAGTILSVLVTFAITILNRKKALP